MVAAQRRAISICLLLGVASTARAMDSPPPPYFEDAALDSSGNLWAYSRAEYSDLYRFDGKRWTEQAAPLAKGERAMPAKVVSMTDGGIACMWRLDEHQFAVTRHQGGESRLLGRCEGEISGSGLWATPLADSHNRLWITGQFPRVYRVDAKGVVLAHEITPEELDKPAHAKENYNEIRTAEDGLGRVWVWSESDASNWASLRGVLIFTDEQVELHDLTASLKKGAKILTVARADSRHMWLAVSNDGLYKVDIETLALERQPDPAPKALCCVHELFVHGSDVYAVERGSDNTNALWRQRGGEWRQIIAVFDHHQTSFLPRSWLPIKEGLLASSFQGGPWFIPSEGKPARFSWRTDFPLNNAHSLLRFADEKFFAIGQGGRLFHGALDLPPHERENPRVVQLDTDRQWHLDVVGHPWMIFRDATTKLCEWDGEHWIAHEIPGAAGESVPDFLRRQAPEIRTDAEGRVWVMPRGENRLRVFEVPTGQWQDFADEQDAYLALRGRPPHFLGSHGPENFNFDPQYGVDGQRIAYREGVIDFRYYDGSTWQRFNRAGISGQKGGDSVVGPPWFDSEGRLCGNFRGEKTTWRRDVAGQWSQTAFESHFSEDIWSEGRPQPPKPVPPAGSVTDQPESITVDNLGTTWLTWHGALYRAVPGRCVQVFAPGEVNPFLAGSLVRSAFVDAHGNALLLIAGTTMEVFLLQAKSPPRTTITVEPVGDDGQRLKWQTESAWPVQFRWRLDEGPWRPTEDTTLTLTDLPNGPHQVTVSAQDTQLQMDANPAVARFETHVDSERQVAGLIARLSDPNYNRRKAAVDGLALQPERAVPALRRARETAGEDLRWWIEAALQQIEAAKPPAPSPEKR